MDDKTYKIVRHFQEGSSETIQTGLTRKEAMEHCNDPETSSHTATTAEAQKLTETKGPWFDGFDEE